MQAFNYAIKAGASTIEFDIHHTKDKETIVYHDEVFGRLIKGNLPIPDKKIQELEIQNIQENYCLENQEKVPLFSDAMKLFGDSKVSIFIEIKDELITQKDFTTMKQNYPNNPEKIFVISFKTKALDHVINQRLVDPYFNKVKTILVKRWGDFGDIKKYDGIDAEFIHGPTIRKYQKQGKIVGVYTKNSESSFRRYLSRGVDFITTNVSPLCEKTINP
jgi:glycerophosphoryl diester phosphodiesterase